MKLLYKDLANEIFNGIDLTTCNRTFIIVHGNKIYSIVWSREEKGYKMFFVCFIRYKRLSKNVFTSPFILKGTLYLYYYDIKDIKEMLSEVFYEQIHHIKKAKTIFKHSEPLKKIIEGIV
jgi:hypothetical protein